jgi:DNA-binding NarL/FixJ family response regulator
MANAFEHLKKHLALDKEIFSKESRKKIEIFNMRVAIAEKEHEREIERLRADSLQQQVAMQAVSMGAQSELLDRFRGQVLEVFREMGEPLTALKKIREKLRDLPKQEIDWTKLETEFAGAHPEFRTKLLEKYPQLTSQQVKMCLLIHLNLKNHEIARLASLSERSVEKHRLNIRRMMKLKSGEDLAEALRKLDGWR